MADGGLNHLIHNFFGRIETCSGGLRHIGDFRAAQFAQIRDTALQDVASVDPNFTAREFHAATPIAKRREADRGFTRAGFTDEAKDLALLQLEIDAMHDLNLVRFCIWWINRRADLETAYFEEWIAHYPRPPLREVVLFKIQSATRFTEIASVAMAKAGTNAAGMP